MNTFETLCSIIRKELMLEENHPLTRDTLFTELDCDSIDLVDIVMDIEDAFSTEISDEDLDSFKSLGDVVNYLDENN